MNNKLKKYFLLVSILSTVILLLGGNFFADRAKAGAAEDSAESLQGAEAVERLKQNGEYDSLTKAVEKARIAGGQTEASRAAESIFSPQTKLLASDGASGDDLGTSIAISGDTAIVGAESDHVGSNANQGAAYIFVRSGSSWTQQAKLTASDGTANVYFGASVAISGTSVIVGAISANGGSTNGSGAAYIFIRSGTNWTQQAKLSASDGATGDGFGGSVGISGANAIVGASFDTVGANSQQGSAYIFVRGGTIWTEEQRLIASDGAANDRFGGSVAVSGTTAIVGVGSDTVGSNTYQGSVYVFLRSGSNAWILQQQLFAADGAAGGNFGSSVAIFGNNLIVGAILAAGSPNTPSQGAAYVFVRSGTTWTQQAKLFPSNGANIGFFGISVAISGDTAIVGTDNGNFSNPDAGAAYIFTRSGTTWTERQKLTPSDGASRDVFGYSVGISGTTAIVGSINASNASNIRAGAAYVYTLTTGSSFDFDGDNKTDISIFRPSNGQWWYYRSSDGGNYAATFGNSTDKLVPGDFTGDGKTDIALFRPSTGEWFILRSENGSYYSFPFGTNGDIPAVGDFDGDGKADTAVFRPSDTNWYIRRSSDGGTTIQQFGQAGDVPVVADYDGDGKTDIAVWRPSAGQWWINRSLLGTVSFAFGNSLDKPVQGDYTGDGKTDVALWRPSNGNWFIMRSEDNSFYSFPFGVSSDTPAPGDYDGDRKFDATVFRPSNSTWFIQRTTAGTLIQSFGISGDKPVPNAFIP
jgi:hypothetical protein